MLIIGNEISSQRKSANTMAYHGLPTFLDPSSLITWIRVRANTSNTSFITFQAKPDLAARPSAFVPSLRSWKSGRCNQPGNLWQPARQPMATLWIGLGEIYRKAPYKKWENRWFPVKIFPNKPIHWMVGSPPGSLVHQWSSWCTMVPNPPNRDPESPWRQRVSARPPPEHRTRTRSQISPEPWLPSIRIIRYQITNKMMNMMMIFFNSTMIYYDYDIIKCFAAQILSKDVHPPKTTSNPHQPSHHARNQLVPVVAGLRMAGNPKSSRSAIFRSQSWCKRATAQRRNFPDSFLREAAHLHKLRKKWMKLWNQHVLMLEICWEIHVFLTPSRSL